MSPAIPSGAYAQDGLTVVFPPTTLAISTLFLSVYTGAISSEALVPAPNQPESQHLSPDSPTALPGSTRTFDSSLPTTPVEFSQDAQAHPFFTKDLLDELFELVHETNVPDWSFRMYAARKY